jgi:diguanylate cyclase (GGDEF)-like protein
LKSAIHLDLKRTERRESHLWLLTFALLILFGTVIVGHFSVVLLSDANSDAGLSRATTYRALGGLFFLVSLFCLYALRTLLLNRKMKSLLVEMSGVATSSMELDDFLPSIARKIAEACSVTSCQIALMAHADNVVRLKAAFAEKNVEWQPQLGKTYTLEKSEVWRRVFESFESLVLSREEVTQLEDDVELFNGGRKDVEAICVTPMVWHDRILGILILGEAGRLVNRRFTPARIDMIQTLATHAAGAIDQSKLKTEAIRDPLTNLYNRRHFSERMREEMVRADREKHVMIVLLCDLDRFKAVNDTRGHDVGDAVLKATARAVQNSTRGADLVFRWGGDEIVVVLSKTSREGALIVANRIREGVINAGRSAMLDMDVSIGIALYPEHGRSEADLIRVADRALYIAKKKSGEKVQVGEEEYRLDRQSIRVVFQPVVDVSSDRILGFEALSRDPQGKLSAFELFEKYRAIRRLNELKQIAFASQIELAHAVGLQRVFVNADFDVLAKLYPISKPTGLEVVVELSELEALRDLDGCLDVARKWRENGYRFAVDDFGSGFVSFPFLAMLVPDYIKVDRSTLLQAVSSKKFRGFLKSLLHAVRTYAPSGIIAEGVEEESELQLVRELGISLVQGFLFGKPKELSPIGTTHESLHAELPVP